METLDAILTRHSVRTYTDEPITDEQVDMLLKCAMSGPSCTNAKDWSFIVVRDQDTLIKMADANGPPANPLRHCPLAILICGDLERAFPPAPDYWVIDGAIAGQNICLAAHAMGLGAVWLGTWPQMERVHGQRKLFDLPYSVMPHSIIALGHPAAEGAGGPPRPSKTDDPASHIHYEKW